MSEFTEATEGGIWYFAHPYTCKDAEGNYVPEAEEANYVLSCARAADLLVRGYNIYSPISHTHPIHRMCPAFLKAREHAIWYKLDNEVIDCMTWKGIILAPLWQTSSGCVNEKERIESRGLVVKYYTDIMSEPVTYNA